MSRDGLKPDQPYSFDTMKQASKATDPKELERQFMDPGRSKSEMEWWAAREIEALRALCRPNVAAAEGEQCPSCGNDYDPMHPCRCRNANPVPDAEPTTSGSEDQAFAVGRTGGSTPPTGAKPCANCGQHWASHPVSPELQCPAYKHPVQ